MRLGANIFSKNLLLPSGVSLFKAEQRRVSGAPSPRRRRYARVTTRTYRVSGAPSPRRQTCTRRTTRACGNNTYVELGCSLTLKSKRHSSDYSQKAQQTKLLAHSTIFRVGAFLYDS